MFKKILIANRGEIAIRIMQAAKCLNIETVAIFHEVDREMPFVHFADYAYQLQAETPKSGYLDIDQIIEIARTCGAEAIHPGYGFLSENGGFSQACEDAGVKFIGPKAHAITVMGSKTGARELMLKAGVPIVPGYNQKATDMNEFKRKASEIGYPVLLKAAAGGGGKGMRLVEREEDLIENYEGAQREAIKSFGDDLVYMEKYVINPKHIEIQILGDEHGNYVYLGERDCSIQRRHQKVIEEAPSNILTEEIRQAMGKVAIDAAKACGYVNAGTIEFLLDINKNFYFLEMNTRLQVEHPVTEIICGLDLAVEQIKIAAGYPLGFTQEDVNLQGHAIECRIYAEDPLENFMPDLGAIDYLRSPVGRGVRVDGGIETGTEVSMHFDPMLAKLITWGSNREDAISKMIAALKDYRVIGFNTIIPFLIEVMEDDTFRNGYFDTGYIPNHFDFEKLKQRRIAPEEELTAVAAFLFTKNENKNVVKDPTPKINNWKVNQLAIRNLN